MKDITKKIWKIFIKKIFFILIGISLFFSSMYLIGFFSYVKFDLDLLGVFSSNKPSIFECIASGFFISLIFMTVSLIIIYIFYLIWDWAKQDIESDEDYEDEGYDIFVPYDEEENEWEK